MNMIAEGKTKLNEEQIKAIKHGKGPLLIIAGAGTGKTTVITQRIAYLIEKKLAKPDEILALTFTEKAAREMEERVDVLVPYGYTNMWISTFHSFCDRILRREALQIGFDPNYKLMTTAETVQLIRRNLFKFKLKYFRPLGNPYKFIDGMLQHFARLQDENINPSEYIKWASRLRSSKNSVEPMEIEKWEELSHAYRTYEELKVREGVMDYGDLIVKTIYLFKTRPNILQEYQKQFKYILIDEFQDTNFAQNELALLLAKKNKNITVVGDDDQSIYRFRGAAVSNIIQFRNNFPKAKVVVLTKNYRTVQKILDNAYDLIQHNNPDRLEAVEKVNKKLISTRKGVKGETIFVRTNRVENEAEAVASQIEELAVDKKYTWRDFAILVRANNHSEPFIHAFQRRGVPYQFLGPGRLFRQQEIIDLISYLRVLYDFDDSTSFWRLLALDYFEINARDLAKIGNFARKYNLSLFEASEKVDEISVSPNTKETVKDILEIINKHLKEVRRESAGQLLYFFLEESGLMAELLKADTPDAQKRAANISKFFDKLKTYEIDHRDATVPAVVDWIDLSMEVGESPAATDTDWSEINAVNILTAHSSKGLEFPVVFLVNLVSQRFPTIERREQIPIPEELIKELLPSGDYHLQEERRLFYVGMTRAKDKLFLTAANFYGEGKREKKVSPFVFESLGDSVQSTESKMQSKQLSFLNFKPHEGGKDLEMHNLHVDYLSYSQIETFKVCPLHYKLKYIFKVPTPPSSAQSFGNSFHLTMKIFYDEVTSSEKPTEKLMYKILSDNWISEGYLSKKHEEESFKKAKRFLKYYLENNFDKKIMPIAMEQPFSIKLGSLTVGGKIDRIDKRGDIIEIIDYKTGANALSQKEADRDLQLSIYALASEKNPEKVKLSLYYFDTPQIVTTARTQKDLDEAKKEILNFRKQIESSDFKCSGNILCQNCEYKLICGSEY